MFCLSSINAQKPPLKNDKFYCNTVAGIDDSEILTDKEGISLEYSENICDVYYKGKLYTGKFKRCENNKIVAVTNYLNGRKNGEEYFYNDNGNLGLYRVFGKDTTDGEVSWETDEEASKKNNRPTFRRIIECSGVQNGEESEYYDNGQLNWKGFYLNGEIEGKWIFYNEKGAIKEIRNYKGGKEDGKWIFYDEKGAVKTIRTYKDGEEISCSGKCD